MKIRTIVISLTVSAALIGGGAYGAYQLARNTKKPVDVVPVENIRMDMDWGWYGSDDTTITGMIVSRDSQNVDLSNEYPISKVYVKAGDTVKRGDPLLEYDMTLVQLQRELEGLNLQLKEMELDSQKRDLEKFRKNPSAYYEEDDAGLDLEDDDLTGSPDDLFEDEGTGGIIDDGGLILDEDGAGDTYPDDFFQDEEDDYSGELIDDDPPGIGSLFEEVDTEGIEEDALVSIPTVKDPDPADTSGMDPQAARIDEDLLETALYFINRVNYLYDNSSSPADMSQEYIDDTLAMFQGDLSALPSVDNDTLIAFTDAFGEIRVQPVYLLSEELLENLTAKQEELILQGQTGAELYKDQMISSLLRAYGNLCLYNLQRRMVTLENALSAKGASLDTADKELLASVKPLISAAADAYYNYREAIPAVRSQLSQVEGEETAEALAVIYQSYLKLYGGSEWDFSAATDGDLSAIIASLVVSETPPPETDVPLVQDPEAVTEEETEAMTLPSLDYPDSDFDYDWDSDPGASSGLTQEYIDEQIRMMEQEISYLELDIREIRLKLKQYDRTLSGKTVTATMDGVVKSAGDAQTGYTGDYFIVVAGQKGMYAQGTITELNRDTVQIGDQITGTSYENDEAFTGEITEISVYPTSGEDNFYNYNSNPNSSSYPFLAYIDEADNLEEGYAEIHIQSAKQENGIYIEKFMVRTDDTGKDYVYIQGEDGLLKKQYVKTGKTQWDYLEVKSGLALTDKIAFPLASNVEEGAKTREVDSLYDDYY